MSQSSHNEQAAADALAALGNRTRLRLFRLLVRAGHDGLNIGEILSHLGNVRQVRGYCQSIRRESINIVVGEWPVRLEEIHLGKEGPGLAAALRYPFDNVIGYVAGYAAGGTTGVNVLVAAAFWGLGLVRVTE